MLELTNQASNCTVTQVFLRSGLFWVRTFLPANFQKMSAVDVEDFSRKDVLAEMAKYDIEYDPSRVHRVQPHPALPRPAAPSLDWKRKNRSSDAEMPLRARLVWPRARSGVGRSIDSLPTATLHPFPPPPRCPLIGQCELAGLALSTLPFWDLKSNNAGIGVPKPPAREPHLLRTTRLFRGCLAGGLPRASLDQPSLP